MSDKIGFFLFWAVVGGLVFGIEVDDIDRWVDKLTGAIEAERAEPVPAPEPKPEPQTDDRM